MRIVYPLLWSTPDRDACETQSVNTVAALARLGHDITLLMPRPAGVRRLDADELNRHFAVEGAFRVIQRPSRWDSSLLPASLIWLQRVFSDPELRGADLLLSRIPAMFVMGQRSPIPFATDHYRPWPDQLPVIRPLVRRAAAAPHCLGLILHSSFAADAYHRCGVAAGKLLVAHNGANPIAAPLDTAAARARVGLPADRAIALYAGRVNAAKGLDQLLALARLRPDLLVVLVGSESDGAIEAEAARLPNVRIAPWQAEADLAVWLQAADVLLIPPSRAPLERFGNCVMPIKLFGYLAAGRPILAPRAPDTAELLKDGVTALLVPPDDPAAAAAGIDRLLADPVLARTLAANARRLSEDLTWDARAKRLSDFLETRLALRSA